MQWNAQHNRDNDEMHYQLLAVRTLNSSIKWKCFIGDPKVLNRPWFKMFTVVLALIVRPSFTMW